MTRFQTLYARHNAPQIMRDRLCDLVPLIVWGVVVVGSAAAWWVWLN